MEINDQIGLVDPRIKTGITVIICRFSSCGVYVDAEQTIVLTISGDCSRLEEGEAVFALKGRHLARGKLREKFRCLVRGVVHIFAGLVKGEASICSNRLDLNRSGARVSTTTQPARTGRGEIDVHEEIFRAVERQCTECRSTYFLWGASGERVAVRLKDQRFFIFERDKHSQPPASVKRGCRGCV